MKRYWHMLLFAFLLLLPVTVLPSACPAAGQLGKISTSPGVIAIGAQFDGIDLHVDGSVPASSDVVVRLTGHPAELHLREKGKVLGLLWMNVGNITVKNMPSVYLIGVSRPFDELGPAVAPYRLQGLAEHLEFEKDPGTPDIDIPNELLLLKKSTGLYNEENGGVRLGPDGGNTRTFSALLELPSSLPPGEYQVEAFAVKDGAVIGEYSSAIRAELVGFPKSLSEIAFKRSMLYGVMATVIAIVSGLLIGWIFQSKGVH